MTSSAAGGTPRTGTGIKPARDGHEEEIARLHTEAQALEDQVPPITAGPLTSHDRRLLTRAAELRRRAAELGGRGAQPHSLCERVLSVISNEVPPLYAIRVAQRAGEEIGSWHQEARERARATALTLFAELMPGPTGSAMAHEIADKIVDGLRIGASGPEANRSRIPDRTGGGRAGSLVRRAGTEAAGSDRG
ncbi:hypothetical protein OG613_47745 (plasmid) [Streptomyces sp. NBC_00015]|uniref:hypothetical protein n=1 Tax=Streptomyces sp. NBC_00015 TaxID=2903611 RepID=UPI002F91BEFB